MATKLKVVNGVFLVDKKGLSFPLKEASGVTLGRPTDSLESNV